MGEQDMYHWDQIYDYFIKQGFPRELLDFVCIRREEALQIADIIQKKEPRAILEIGTFIGLSTGLFALTSPPQCIVVGVDPNFPVLLLSQQFHLFEKRQALYFLKNMLRHFEVSHKVALLEGYFSYTSSAYRDRFVARGGNPQFIDCQEVPIIGTQVEAFAPYDFVFLDGDHSMEVVYRDLSKVQRYLAENGIIILHDIDEYNYWEPEVLAGIMRFRDDFPAFGFDRIGNLGFLSKQPISKYVTNI
jgi:SAM-dependent methyltransferase